MCRWLRGTACARNHSRLFIPTVVARLVVYEFDSVICFRGELFHVMISRHSRHTHNERTALCNAATFTQTDSFYYIRISTSNQVSLLQADFPTIALAKCSLNKPTGRSMTPRRSHRRRRPSSDIALSQMAPNLLPFATDFLEQHHMKVNNLVPTL